MTDITAAELAWGMWRFRSTDRARAAGLVHAALDHGLTLFDTADIYGGGRGGAFGAAETLLGEVLADDKTLRGRMVLASKGGIMPGAPYDSAPPIWCRPTRRR